MYHDNTCNMLRRSQGFSDLNEFKSDLSSSDENWNNDLNEEGIVSLSDFANDEVDEIHKGETGKFSSLNTPSSYLDGRRRPSFNRKLQMLEEDDEAAAITQLSDQNCHIQHKNESKKKDVHDDEGAEHKISTFDEHSNKHRNAFRDGKQIVSPHALLTRNSENSRELIGTKDISLNTETDAPCRLENGNSETDGRWISSLKRNRMLKKNDEDTMVAEQPDLGFHDDNEQVSIYIKDSGKQSRGKLSLSMTLKEIESNSALAMDEKHENPIGKNIYDKPVGEDKIPKQANNNLLIGEAQLKANDYSEANSTLSKCLSAKMLSLGPNHIEVAKVSSLVGDALIGLCRNPDIIAMEKEDNLNDAENKFEGALSVLHAAGDPEACAIMKKLGDIYFLKGDHEKALTSYKKSASDIEETFGRDSKMFSSLKSQIALVHFKLKDYYTAVPCLKNALENMETVPIEDQATNMVCMEIAYALGYSIYKTNRDLVTAVNYFIKCIKLGKKVSLIDIESLTEVHLVCGDHSDVINSFAQLGSIFMEQRKYDLAEHCYKELRLYGTTLQNIPVAKIGFDGQLCVFKRLCGDKMAQNMKLIECYEDMLDFFHTSSHNESLDAAEVYYCLGILYEKSGDLDRAHESAEKALAIKKPLLDDKREVFRSLQLSSELSLKVGKLDNAIDHCKEVVRISNTNDVNIQEKVMALRIMAKIYEERSQIELARDQWEEILDLQKKILGDKHLNVTTSLVHLGIFYDKNCQYDTAMDYFKEAFIIRQEKIGSHDRLTIIPLFHMGRMYVKSARYYDANRCFDRVASAMGNILSLPSFQNAEILQTLAHAKGMIEEEQYLLSSIKLYEESIAQFREILGPKDEHLVHVYLNVGAVYVKMDDYSSANRCYDEALAISELHRMVSLVVACKIAIGDMYSVKDQFKFAEKKYVEALSLIPNKQSEAANLVKDKYGILLLKKQQGGKALTIFRQNLERRKATIGNDHPEVALTVFRIGKAYETTGEIEKAEKKYEEALSVLEQNKSFKIHPYKKQICLSLSSLRGKKQNSFYGFVSKIGLCIK